ncbi:MAG: hypothetical protein CR982_09510 [Candidatus Cloacimonadota bacterium]|nr:MAG: hypothetical protein CR982_09510 [Candidatus Cloacimonadota bacterium]PIE79276.1 MAG: hypothetical protein CSA15_03685 [Candidatus Delongbacteria bacterium]
MGVKFEKTQNYNLDKVKLIERIKIALKKSKFKIKNIDEKNGLIHARSKLNFSSWTEKISIKVDDNGDVTIKSKCFLPTQIVDWGKNEKNVKKIFNSLDWDEKC